MPPAAAVEARHACTRLVTSSSQVMTAPAERARIAL